MIQAEQLVHRYGTFTAVQGISFEIPRGQVVGLVGPNGAGKSTTMKLLTGYLAPSAGTARIAGYNMATERLQGAKHLGRTGLFYIGDEETDETVFALPDAVTMGVRVGRHDGSRAGFYVHHQAEVEQLLRLLVECMSGSFSDSK